MNTNRKSLRDRAKDFSVQLPFMEGREKAEIKDVMGTICTITDYGFLRGDDDREYAAFITKEHPKHFFFGGQVLTDQLQRLDEEGYRDDIVSEGLPFIMTEKRSRNGRNYVNVAFYPEA